MDRTDAKRTLISLSVVATVAGWAVLAGREGAAPLAVSAPPPLAVSRAAPPAARGGAAPAESPPMSTGPTLAPTPPAVASAAPTPVTSPPRAIARTRTSR